MSLPEESKEQVNVPATAPVESAAHSQTQPAKSKKMFFVGAGILVVLVLVATVGYSLVRVYKQGSTDAFTVSIARALNLPAFKVNDQVISYAAYVDDIAAIHHVQQYSLANGGQSAPTLSDAQLSDQVIQRLVQDSLINEMAHKYGVTVSARELDDYKNEVLSQKGVTTTAAADTILTAMYGWNLSTYEAKVMQPVLLYKKVSDKIQTDTDVQKQIREFALDRAKFIIANIKTDEDFTKFAMQYGEDGTAASGGDLGWFSHGDMQVDFEKAAFALKKGEMTQVPVESPYGFHIIKVDDHKVNKVKDAKTGKMVDQDQVKARHILITPSLDKYLEMKLKQSSLHFYIPVHNPFENK